MMETKLTTDYSLRAILQRLRVPLGFISAILFVLGSQPAARSLAIGLPIALGGAAIRAWASGHLRKNAELAMSGPYAHTRNPLYFGSFMMAVGCAVCGGNFWLGSLLIGLFLLIYWPVMRAEAAHMQTLFAGAYTQWAANVPLFFPRLTPYAAGQPRSFDPRQYRHHREYRALVGLAIVIGLLFVKAVKNY
ncbi:MAG: methyltransferase family protein [Blastocatellia bacterium]